MSTRLGILGGGQLAMYLCKAARGLDVETWVFSDDDDAPAAHCADRMLTGRLDDRAAIAQFISGVDVVTFDREDIPESTVNQLLAAASQGRVRVHPGAAILQIIQDKGLQKQWLEEHDFPTVPYQLLPGSGLNSSSLNIELPLVQKSRCGGYDGRGVQIIEDQEGLESLWLGPSLVEPFIEDRIEIAVITARNTEGAIQSYPPVQMEFNPQLNTLALVTSPARLSGEVERRAVTMAESLVTQLQGVGVFAVEMFLTGEDTLLINEVSPRVHNSGHLTLEASDTSQFEQHLRAVLGLPLADVSTMKTAAMVNILYEDALEERCPALPTSYGLNDCNATVHWYGKKTGQSGRKMGHITALSDTVTATVRQVQAARGRLTSTKASVAA